MIKNKRINYNFICSVMMIIFGTMLIISGDSVSMAVKTSVNRCLNIIIPSLFAFTALSTMLISSGSYRVLSAPFGGISKYIIGMPKNLFAVFILSNIGGYPIGVKLLRDMCEQGQISEKTAKEMCVFCYCGGPAFYSGAIGQGVFGSTKIGMLIFVSVFSANLLMSVIICRIFKPEENHSDIKPKFSAQILTDSVSSAGRSMFVICTMIIFFSSVISITEYTGIFERMQKSGLSENFTVIVKSLLEITYLTELKGKPYYLLPVISAVCSFGGVCILLQLAAINKGSFSLKHFMLTRIPCAVLSAVLCKIFLKFINLENIGEISANAYFTNKICLVKSNNFVPSICLILMILLLNMKKRLVFSKKM